MFYQLIGCHPPLISDRIENMCNKTFDLSSSDENIRQVLDLIDNLFTDFHSTACKKPCTYFSFETRLMYSFTTNKTENAMKLVLDKVVDLTQTSFLIGVPSLFTGLGGAISAGRTLL